MFIGKDTGPAEDQEVDAALARDGLRQAGPPTAEDSAAREQIAKARQRATHDLKIADNTFETVQASFELNNLMRDGAASFEALQKLEAPTFEQIFRNEELRREFEALTRKLDQPTS